MNIFEGSRRIAKIIAGIWVIIWICAAIGYSYDLYERRCISLSYEDNPNVSFIRCGSYGKKMNQDLLPFIYDEIDKEAYLLFVGGLVFIWGFTWAMGYIVRGFRGIPRGQDYNKYKK